LRVTSGANEADADDKGAERQPSTEPSRCHRADRITDIVLAIFIGYTAFTLPDHNLDINVGPVTARGTCAAPRPLDDLASRQAQAPGHPRAIVWLRLAAWDS